MPRVASTAAALLRRLLREPLVHFFLLGALLFGLRSAWGEEERTIVVTSSIRKDLARRFRDAHGRQPTAAELSNEVGQWQREEALFREALRLGLDRDDPSVRTVLIDKMRALADFEVQDREPSDEQLRQFLEQHRSRYEKPLRYDFQFIEMDRTESGAESKLERLEVALQRGDEPASLGSPVHGGNLRLQEMEGRLPPELVQRLPELPVGTWHRVATEQAVLLARVRRVEGGLPSLEGVRPLLAAEWAIEQRNAAVDRILQRTVDRYQFEQQP